MAVTTPLYRDVERAVGGDLEEFLRIRRARGDSWDVIAMSIRVDHDRTVNSETLRDWAKKLGINGTRKAS